MKMRQLIERAKAMGKDLEQRSKELTDLFERVRALESALNRFINTEVRKPNKALLDAKAFTEKKLGVTV